MTDRASAEGLTPDSGLVWRQCICGAWYWGVAQTDGDKATSRALPDRASAEGLRETFAEGLHKAMCFAPTTLHNRLACERPLVYLGLAEALLGNPAVQAALRDHSDSGDTTEYRLWDGSTLVIGLSDTDPGDMGEPRMFRSEGVEYIVARASTPRTESPDD